jgi:hypothetical protein
MINSELSYWLARLAEPEMVAYTGEGILVNSGTYDNI